MTALSMSDKMGKINLPYPNLLGTFQLNNVSTAISVARNLKQFQSNPENI